MLYQVEFARIVWVVNIPIESFFNVCQSNFAFLFFLCVESLARLVDGHINHKVFPHLIGWIELSQYMHHLLKNTHGTDLRQSKWRVRAFYGIRFLSAAGELPENIKTIKMVIESVISASELRIFLRTF
jgi:hypothetical protein